MKENTKFTSRNSLSNRREFLSKVGTGAGLLFSAGSVSATDDIGTLAKTEPEEETWMSLGDDNDKNSDRFGEGQLTMEGFRSNGISAPGGWEVRIDQESNALTYRDDKNSLIDHLYHSTLDVIYDSDDNGYVDAMERPSTIGGYTGTYERDDDYSMAEAVLETGYESFINTIGSALGGLVYGATTLIGEIWAKWDGASDGTGYVNREWLWNREYEVSNWSRYHAFVEDKEVLEITFSHLVNTVGYKDLFADFTMRLWGARISVTELDNLSASEAKKHNIEVYDLEAVEDSPEKFGVTDSFLKDYPYDHLYKKPLRARIIDRSEEHIHKFVNRHEDKIDQNMIDSIV